MQNDLRRVRFDSLLSGAAPFADSDSDADRQTDLPRLRAGRVGGQVEKQKTKMLKSSFSF